MGAPHLEIMLGVSIYQIEAIKRAAYEVADRVTVEILETDAGYRCVLHPSKQGADGDALRAEFLREVLDQELRLSIAKETEGVRNLVLSLAFSKTVPNE